MIALYIIGALVLLILLILFSSVSVYVSNSENLSVKVGFWFLRFKVFPVKDKAKVKKKSKQEEKTKDNAIKRMISEKGVVATVGELAAIGKTILTKAGQAAKHIRVKKLYFLVTAASGDPAKTAVVYGSLCSVVFPALNGFQSLLKFNDRKTKVSVLSDFNSETPIVELDLKIKLRIWFILKAALGVLLQLVRRKMKESTAVNLQNKK